MNIDKNSIAEAMTEVLKMTIKQQIGGNVSSKTEALTKELQTIINNAADAVATKVLDETKIEEIAKAAKAGATYTAINQLISTVSDYAFEEASPIVSGVLKQFSDIMFEAMKQAVYEIVNEEVNKRIQELK